MEPINYAGTFAQQPSVGDQFLQGLQVSQAMQAQAEAKRQAEEQAKAKAEQEAAMQADIMDVYNRGAPASEVARLTVKYPALAKQYKDTHEMLSKDEQMARKAFGAQVDSALQSGKVDIAKQLIDQRIQAAENSGNQQEAQAWKATRQVVETDPNAAKLMSSSYMAAIDDKYASSIATVGKEARDQAQFPDLKRKGAAEAIKAEAEAVTQGAIAQNAPQAERAKVAYQQMQSKKIQAEIDNMSSRLALDRDKLDFEVQSSLDKLSGNPLSGDAAKIVNESVMQAGKLKTQASQAKSLADKFEKEGGGFGFGSTIAEKFAQFTGSQDTVTALRQEFERVSASNVISLLPPGPATDKDIAIIRAGFPPATADSKTIADFLRSMARVQEYEALSKDAQAAWVDMTGSLGTARKGIEVNGIRVPAGTRYQDFAQTYIKRQELSQKYGN